jgi:hypothetical protein
VALGYDIDAAWEQRAVGDRDSLAEQTERRGLLHRSAAGGDAQLPIDRADFGADGVAGYEQPLRDLAEREMG